MGTTSNSNFWSRSIMERVGAVWRSIMGPSRREVRLSKQRIAALERAERAEAISFEAVAETAKVGRERDEALKKLEELEKTLAETQRKLNELTDSK
jgi:hypothetical protein